MKRFFAMLLVSLTLLSCMPSFAEVSPAGEPEISDAGAAQNGEGAYRVIVSDQNGDRVEGAVIQFCDDVACFFQPTDGEGMATFAVEEQKVYEVHVLQAPEGYTGADEVYHTLEAWSDVSIVLEKADQAGQDQGGEGL